MVDVGIAMRDEVSKFTDPVKPDEVLAAWNARKDSREAMIRLGGILQDLEFYVDNCLKFGESGEVVGRNGGIKGWLFDNLPELLPKYKTLMRCKAMAVRLRQATDTNPNAAGLHFGTGFAPTANDSDGMPWESIRPSASGCRSPFRLVGHRVSSRNTNV